MDTNKMRDISREQFEAKFPAPAGVAWKEAIGMYEVVDIWKLDQAITIGKYNWLWEGWQASREAVVVELPEPDLPDAYIDEPVDRESEEFRYLEARHGAQYQTYRKCRKAIEAQGLKVEVKP